MKKIKRVMALVGVALLLILYILTFVFALIDNENTMNMFKVCVLSTIIIPVMIWAYELTYRWISKVSEDKYKQMTEDADAAPSIEEKPDTKA